jgi:hypothetical protein
MHRLVYDSVVVVVVGVAGVLVAKMGNAKFL